MPGVSACRAAWTGEAYRERYERVGSIPIGGRIAACTSEWVYRRVYLSDGFPVGMGPPYPPPTGSWWYGTRNPIPPLMEEKGPYDTMERVYILGGMVLRDSDLET